MNNERDCKHGQLARSCERCADEQEIAELRQDAERYRWLRDAENGGEAGASPVERMVRPHAEQCADLERRLRLAVRQWDTWKAYALELQTRLAKYEGGSPMLLNDQSLNGWLCSKCGTDRTKAACPKGHSAALTGECPMVGTAA